MTYFVLGSGEGKSDVTTDGESSRPGYVTVCHNCGTESKNFHCCDSCRRTIPRGSKVLPDRLHQAFLSGIKTGPGINSSFIAERKTPTRKKVCASKYSKILTHRHFRVRASSTQLFIYHSCFSGQ